MSLIDTAPTLLGGISSSFHTNPYTGGHIEVRRAHGATIELTDGRELLDTFMAHGSTVLGHAEPTVFRAVQRALEAGIVLGYETGLAATVADRLARILPGAERIRFCSTGTEAVTTALRMCRAHTGRDLVIKIDGHYNGGSDYAMLNSTAAAIDPENPVGRPSQRIRSCSGIPETTADSIIPIPWNDPAALESALSTYEERVAAVIMVPLDLNNGCITPADGYLEAARRLTEQHGALLVFDEVLSGFKTGLNGATGMYGANPDVTIWSKAMASSFPVSVIAGREDVMAIMATPLPQGALQGGTHAGNVPGLAARVLRHADRANPNPCGRDRIGAAWRRTVGACAERGLRLWHLPRHQRPDPELCRHPARGRRGPGQALLHRVHRGGCLLPHRFHGDDGAHR
jgi:glutamate-1-semialdehyde 2,1-aminomutase